MARYSLRSWQRPSIGKLLVTVLLDQLSGERQIAKHHTAAELSECLTRYATERRLPVTWGLFDPMHAISAGKIMKVGISSEVPHEIALLGDSEWMGPAVGCSRFARELTRRVMQARSSGLPVTSLLTLNAQVAHHQLDFVVKQGITAVAFAGMPARRFPPSSTPRPLRYGVWEIPCSARLPGRSNLFPHTRLERRIRRAADRAMLCHLVLDLPAITCKEGAGKKATKLLDAITQWRDLGIVQVETLATVAGRLSDIPHTSPQRSILRAAG